MSLDPAACPRLLALLARLRSIATALADEVLARYPAGSQPALDASQRRLALAGDWEVVSELLSPAEGEEPLLPGLQAAAPFALALHELVVEAGRVTGRGPDDPAIATAAKLWSEFNAQHRAAISAHPGTAIARQAAVSA